MKQFAILLFVLSTCWVDAKAQRPKPDGTHFEDIVVIDKIPYEITTLGGVVRAQYRQAYTRLNGWGKRKDGKPMEEYEASSLIITPVQENEEATYNALRKAFTKEQITENIGLFIQMFFVLAPDGTILETGYMYPYDKNNIRITPEQIAIFDREISGKLKFTIDPKKADLYLYIPCNIMFGFAYFANYRVKDEHPGDGSSDPAGGRVPGRP